MLGSNIPANTAQNAKGDFYLKGVNWYRIFMDIDGKQVYWDSNVKSVDAAGNETLQLTWTWKEHNDNEDPRYASQYWALSKDQVVGQNNIANTRKVYNLAEGSAKVLTTVPNAGAVYARFFMAPHEYVDKGATQNFDIAENDDNRHYIYLKYHWYKNEFLNFQRGSDANRTPYLSLSYYKKELFFEKIEDPFDLELRIKNTLKAENVVGGFTTEQLKKLKDAYATDTITRRYAEYLLADLDKQQRVPMHKDGYYRIRSANYEYKTPATEYRYVYYDYTEKKLKYKTATQENVVNDIFYIHTSDQPFQNPYPEFEGQLIVPNTLGETHGLSTFVTLPEGKTPKPASEAKYVEFIQPVRATYPAQYVVNFEKIGNRLTMPENIGNTGDLVSSGASQSEMARTGWYLEPVETFIVSTEPYATFCLPFTVECSEPDLYVRSFRSESEGNVSAGLKPIAQEGQIVGGTPTIVYCKKTEKVDFRLKVIRPNSYTLYTFNTSGRWKGTFCPLPMSAEDIKNRYIIYNHGSKGPGFYLLTEAGTFPANKVYFTSDKILSSGAKEFLSISEGETTGITSVEVSDEDAATYYDLSGRRVMNPTKGIYINSKGKKIVINK